MKTLPVYVDSIQDPIQPSPGFEKKLLSEYKLDVLGLCGFGCSYCSSNNGYYLRINRARFADATEQQTGRRVLPAEEPRLTFVWSDILANLARQLANKRPGWGAGKTLVFSMLTDGFSPEPLKSGTTEAVLRLVLERTAFRIRVLTKNAIVGADKWLRLFSDHPDRFVVGLSIGTSDNAWARRVEMGTSTPSARLGALHRLQNAGVPTFGMLCPAFPDMFERDRLERLVDEIHPEFVEHFWAEPYNDRDNWQGVRAGYAVGSAGYDWLTRVYEHGDKALWSAYAAELYPRLRDKADREGWLSKLRYLLYELDVTAKDAAAFAGLKGVLLQAKPGADGRSQNEHIAEIQRRLSPAHQSERATAGAVGMKAELNVDINDQNIEGVADGLSDYEMPDNLVEEHLQLLEHGQPDEPPIRIRAPGRGPSRVDIKRFLHGRALRRAPALRASVLRPRRLAARRRAPRGGAARRGTRPPASRVAPEPPSPAGGRTRDRAREGAR